MKSKDEIDNLRWKVLNFLGYDEGSTDNPHLSFECGVLAALDWMLDTNSMYAEIVSEDLEDWEVIDLVEAEQVAIQEKRIWAAKRMAQDVWSSLDHGTWGDPEEHFMECVGENKEFTLDMLPYVIEARDRLLKEFERRCGREECTSSSN